MNTNIIDGREIAKQMKKQLQKNLIKIKSLHKKTPQITTITIGTDPASQLYLRLRDNACKEIGIRSTHIEFPQNIQEKKVTNAIHQLNTDPDTQGILLQFPLPKHLSSETLTSTITPQKDVEGFHPLNMGRTMIGDEFLVPCTPLAVITILEHEHINAKGQNVVIVNHSTVVGKPLTAMLLNRNATVSICHVYTRNLEHYTTNADILVTATGVPNLITENHVKTGAIVIDVGIIQTKKGVCGDVDFTKVQNKVKKITPVPGGVGPVTIACSLQNMLKTYQNSFENNV